MRNKVCNAVIRAGGTSAADHTISWNGTVLDLVVQRSGLAAFVVSGTTPLTDAPALLETNPVTGWTWVLLPDGRAARRVILAPIQWTSPDRLATELDRLVAGEPSADEPACCEPLFPLLDAESAGNIRGVCRVAVALLLLRGNARAWDRTRYVLAGHGLRAPEDIHLAGDSAEAIAVKCAADGPVIEALVRHPHISAVALQLWTAGPGSTTTEHPVEGARQEASHD